MSYIVESDSNLKIDSETSIYRAERFALEGVVIT